mmetsp:Transcript_10656/g.9379  ORF Transcript_10656/g.9379 Transcript_10656/m.9379 type:complete len:234 (-) Transcript_10656:48-749(-)
MQSLQNSNMLNLNDFTETDPNLFTTPSPETFNKMMKKLNILSESTVIMYNGISAAKAWFIMKYYGHPSTMILDGGIREWKRLDYPINTMKTPVDYTSAPVKTFTAKEPNTSMVIEYEEVLKKVGNDDVQIVDIRSPDQFASKEHNGLGHIPGAVNIHFADFYDRDGKMKDKEQLNELFSAAGLDKNKEVITYDHGGVTACIGYSALEELGFEGIRMYDGSWAEYSSKDETRES